MDKLFYLWYNVFTARKDIGYREIKNTRKLRFKCSLMLVSAEFFRLYNEKNYCSTLNYVFIYFFIDIL